MGFGSIHGIPPLPPIVGPRTPSDVNHVFAAEFNRQQGREADAREESRRGLEDEESDPEIESAEESPAGQPGARLHLFA